MDKYKIAVDLGQVASDARADQRLYRLSPPLQDHDGNMEWQYVVSSAVMIGTYGAETYLFGADETGVIQCWGELPGSMAGTLKHSAALAKAGYEVIGKAEVTSD